MVTRGRARFGIYCTPCHDGTGAGNGLVKKRAIASGATAFVPQTFHQDRLRHMPDGQLFATISNGKNNMPPYAMQIPVNDRWAIVSYVRALQVAQPKGTEATQ
jgi:mono/diheme cytochrome c family protein